MKNHVVRINQKNLKPYTIACNFLSAPVLEIPIRFLKVIGISTIFKLF